MHIVVDEQSPVPESQSNPVFDIPRVEWLCVQQRETSIEHDETQTVLPPPRLIGTTLPRCICFMVCPAVQGHPLLVQRVGGMRI